VENIVFKVPFGELGDIGDVLKCILLGFFYRKIFLDHTTRTKDALYAFAPYRVVDTTQTQ
jgi:hypothetical protein